MKIIFLLLMISGTCAAQIIDNNCKSPISGTGITTMDKLHEEMHIDTNAINTKDVTTELLFNEPVSDLLSDFYAKESFENDSDLTLDEYKEIFSQDNPRNLIIKFTIKNSKKKENIFLVSAIASAYECNIRYNGYIIVKREF